MLIIFMKRCLLKTIHDRKRKGYASGLFVLVTCNFIFAQNELKEAIETNYPTKDWVISDFIVTEYGAKSEKGFDNRAAFQAAIDDAYEKGGGVVYIPTGNYEFYSTQTDTISVRVREGDQEFNKRFDYEYVLKLPSGVQLRGDWADPDLHQGQVLGTILEVRVGKDSPNHDGKIESWWNDPQANNVLRTTYTSIADRFIDMMKGTGVTNLSIWYPEQRIDDVTPYPWSLYQSSGNSVTVENVTLVNSYNGFYSAPSELHYLLNSYFTALNTGIEIHVCTDIGRIENIKINPSYWAESGLAGAPTSEEILKYTKNNGTGFKMHRSDWEYVSYLDISGYQTGIWIGREPGFTDSPNAQFYGINVENCEVGLYIEDVNPYGLLFSNSTFGASEGGLSVYLFEHFQTSVQFRNVDFNGPVLSDGKDGVISFNNCSFNKFERFALNINSGNVLLSQVKFERPMRHVFLGEDVNIFKSWNSGFDRKLEIDHNNPGTTIEIHEDNRSGSDGDLENIETNISQHPRPFSNRILRADLPKTTGFNNLKPSVDVSAELQAALYEMKSAGGGTVYLPSGRYLVDNPIIIPSGVELRGTWDVQHHSSGGGTALFTNYDGSNSHNGASLIQMEENSGIRGFKVIQSNLISDGFDIDDPRQTPFLIQGKGKNVYIINITVPAGDKGIDLASYNTSGHYVDYFAGVLARAGIWVGGGAERGFIRNTQFNPHYGTRHPAGGQGYPRAPLGRYIQSHCSAFKFADVKDQTIFNNFVYGSVYGIHFLKDEVTKKSPDELRVIGHGSDGCTYALFVEDADENTRIVMLNSQLVNTQIKGEPVRSYVLMGKEENTPNVHPDAQLILSNSAFWGSPTVGAIINNGTVFFQQANFQRTGKPCIDVRGGGASISTSYFAEKLTGGLNHDNVYGRLHSSARFLELNNNYYQSGLRNFSENSDKISGLDMGRED